MIGYNLIFIGSLTVRLPSSWQSDSFGVTIAELSYKYLTIIEFGFRII